MGEQGDRKESWAPLPVWVMMEARVRLTVEEKEAAATELMPRRRQDLWARPRGDRQGLWMLVWHSRARSTDRSSGISHRDNGSAALSPCCVTQGLGAILHGVSTLKKSPCVSMLCCAD